MGHATAPVPFDAHGAAIRLGRLAFLSTLLLLGVLGCPGDDTSTGDPGPSSVQDLPDRRERPPSSYADAGQADAGSQSGLDDDGEPDTGGSGLPEADAGAGAGSDVVESPDTGTSPDLDEADTDPVPTGPVGQVAGVVWAPGNAPGMVPDGQEIPVSGAIVYLTEERPAPVPQTVYCEECSELPRISDVTDRGGRFVINDVVAGDYWLVIQKGQFRRELQVTVEAETRLDVPTADTTLPSVHDEENGMWIPRIAIAVGSFDQLEDIFGKMDIGEVDSYGEFVPTSAGDRIDFWDNGGYGFETVVVGTLTQLVNDLDRMLEYHIIFIPCSGSSQTNALYNVTVLRNLREYVAAGGKLYVTDWSGEWMDNVFPAPIQLGGYEDTPASAYNPDTDTWNTALFGDADGSPYDTPNAEAVDDALAPWLDGQSGPTAHADDAVDYTASNFEVEGNWNVIESVNTIQVGTDEDGEPIFDTPQIYVIGGSDYAPLPKNPLTVTFEPVGCGRVLYSTYHTTDDVHPGLTPQERVLLYLIMEIGVCRGGKEYYDY